MKNSSISLKKTMADRLRLLREKLGLTQKDLATQMGMTLKSISNIETKEHLPTIPMIINLIKDYQLSPLWFLMGEGEMFLLRLEATQNQVENFKKTFPDVPAEPDVIKMIESMAAPVMKNALILKSLELKEDYKSHIEEYEKEKAQE